MLTVYTPSFFHSAEERYDITDEERERMKALEVERGQLFDKFYRFGRNAEPSIVLDDFLFLGDIQHATNRNLLEAFQISRLHHASRPTDVHSRV